VARAQARYLYLLAIVGCFFLAYRPLANSADAPAFQIPVINVPVHPSTVLAAGPLALGLLLLATFGSFRALKTAYKELGGDERGPRWFEALDTSPNAIDFIFYSEKAHSALARLGSFAYPVYLSVFVGEALWILAGIEIPPGGWGTKQTFFLFGAVSLSFCAFPFGRSWERRIRELREEYAVKKSERARKQLLREKQG
jgi:hypothetical protein